MNPEAYAVENKTEGTPRLAWLDGMKAIALVWIFLNHLVEWLLGSPLIGNPTADWPAIGARVSQLRPLSGHGIWTVPLNLLRYVGWTGDQGVQLFLIASGFGLTWGLLNRGQGSSLSLLSFYRRRAGRIYPIWWATHALFVLSGLLVGWGLPTRDPRLYLSLAGLRITPDLFYYFSPAWWYFGLLLQLYLVYPYLWHLIHRWGPRRLLIIGCAIGFVARSVGLVSLDSYLDAWQRGAVFVTRVPEFILGMSLAAWMYRAPNQTDCRLRSSSIVLSAVAIYVIGTVLSLTLLGMTIAPFLLGVGAFVLLYAILNESRVEKWWCRYMGGWLGRHSLSLFLLHHPVIYLMLSPNLVDSRWGMTLGLVGTVLGTGLGALALENVVRIARTVLGRWHREAGLLGAALRTTSVCALVAAGFIGAELLVRWRYPQEVLGWGERPSLQPDPTFGWRLKPSTKTRLRWESYDYSVTANSLGFPGPEYPYEKPDGSIRILTLGDAFTSAEGVDTTESWPRLLETNLRERLQDQRVEVLNFAVTGYGPNQYAAVAESFVPLYRPDLIIVAMFVNDYQDVLVSNEQFRRSIGFHRQPQAGWKSVLKMMHLRSLISVHGVLPLKEVLTGSTNSYGYFLGNFRALERTGTDTGRRSQQLVSEQLGRINAVGRSCGSEIMVVMIPAPVQVCGPADLAYYPRHVDLNNSDRFDVDLPQKTTYELAERLGLRYYDLRPALGSSPEGCPYQPRNMHWTAWGHRMVADHLTRVLQLDGYVRNTR